MGVATVTKKLVFSWLPWHHRGKHSPNSINYVKHSMEISIELDINWLNYISQHFWGPFGDVGPKFQKYIFLM